MGSYIIAKRMVAVIAITVTVIIAQFSRMTSMITPANRNAAVIIVNRRRDHEFVINHRTSLGKNVSGAVHIIDFD